MQEALAPWLEKAEVRVALIYDEYPSGVRAVQVYERLVHSFEGALFQLHLWKFEPMGMPEVRREAVTDTREADVLMVSLFAEGALASQATVWVRDWTGRRTTPGAFALLLHGSPASSKSAAEKRLFFQQVAFENQMSFFVTEDHELLEREPASLGIFKLSHLDRIVPAGTHWGLDE